MKISNLILVGIFLLLIFGFGIGTLVTPDKDKSALENRELQQRPDLTIKRILSGDYFKKFTAYFNDQFLGRNDWVEAESKVKKHVLKKRVVHSIYVAKDGYLIEPIKKGQLSPETVADKVNAFASDMKKRNIDVYFALAPQKTVMLGDQLPKYLPSYGNQLSDAVLKDFSKNVKAIDLRSAIKPHMGKQQMYFYTDHHWKPKAAFYGYREVIQKMAQQHPNLGKPLQKNQFTWKKDPKPFYGSYARKVGKAYVKHPDHVTIVKAKFKEKPYRICYKGSCDRGFNYMKAAKSQKVWANRYQVYLGGSLPEVTIQNPNKPQGQNLLILKDSYSHPMIQFLARHFKEIDVLDLRHTDKNVYKYVEKHDIDTVLFVHNIETLVDNKAVTQFHKPDNKNS
ncbi:MAG TPA: DHHW family protein [Bacillales bacterium]|nr:DHHW family protein [Bacillales bacterium]